jgi:hypothetical protein
LTRERLAPKILRVNPLTRRPANRWALAVCLFFIVVGSRWAVVDRFDMDLPVWDQWDAEGLFVLAPWYEHHLTLSAFFQPQNEHRVVLTKLLNFGLAVANGQWDQRLEAAVNAGLAGAIAIALFIFSCRNLERRWHAPLFLLLAAGYALPLAWNNVLGGFHSQQFFLIGLSFGAIAWLPRAAPWTRSWWLGAACAVLALGSMASGFFAAVVVIGLLIVRLLRRETSLRDAGPALTLCAVAVAVACATRVSVYYHEGLKAHGAGDFIMSAVHSLQWPAVWTGWAAVLIWLPWCWLTRRVFAVASAAARDAGYTLAGLGGWVLLQILATAYARGAGGAAPASRYIDTLVFGGIINGMSICWLWQNGTPARWSRPILTALGLAWSASFGAGVAYGTEVSLKSDLPPVGIYYHYCELNTHNYLVTGNEAYLQHREIPFPGTDSFLVRIRVPALQAILPVGVRVPIELTGSGRESTFVRHDSRSPAPSPTGFSPATHPLTNSVTWGSFGARASGEWESIPLHIRRPGWLKFEVAGQAGEPGVALELRDAATHELLASVKPGKVPNDSWRSAYVPAPAKPFVVVAHNEDPGRWLAFSPPIEMKTLSYWAWRGVKNGLLIAEAATGAALFLGAATWRGERKQ